MQQKWLETKKKEKSIDVLPLLGGPCLLSMFTWKQRGRHGSCRLATRTQRNDFSSARSPHTQTNTSGGLLSGFSTGHLVDEYFNLPPTRH